MEKYLTTTQVARRLQLKPAKIYEYIKAGKLKAHRLGGNGKSRRHWRVSESSLDDFITGRHNAGSAQDKGSQNNNNGESHLSAEPAVHRGGD